MSTKFNKCTVQNYTIVTYPLFTPVVAILLLQLTLNLLYIFIPSNELYSYIEEGNFISKLTIAGYLILFVALIGTFLDFVKSRHLFDYASFCVLAFCAFAREQELLRWVMGREDSALNLKFLTNVNNSIQIKILVILIFVALVLAFIHLARQYAIKIIKEFFRFGATAWSFATFVLFFLLGQSIDSVPSKLEKFVNIHLSNELQLKLEAVEECTEIFLPIVAAIIFVQFHYMLKNKEE